MEKYKYLLKNIGIFTLSSFGSKILSFIMIPLYTSVLSTSEYGIYDIYLTTVSLCIPVLTLDIVSAVMRFSLDQDIDEWEIFLIGTKRVFVAIVIFICLTAANLLLHVIPVFEQYTFFLVLMFIGTLLYDLLAQFCRGMEKVADVAIAGIINSFVMIGLNIFLLVYVKAGLKGYFIANCAAYYVAIIYLYIRLKIWKNFSGNKHNRTIEREMVNYSRPLVVDTISWWINNVSDRYIVTWLCGVAANGIYSVAYKIPSVLNIFQNIFNQAWALSAVKEFEDKEGKFYTNIYRIYNCGMVLVCSVLLAMDKFIARILFANEFYEAWKYAPVLMISVVFGSLCGVLGGVFSAAKESKKKGMTTAFGAGVNIILNIILVYYMGSLGAGIATLVSYILVWYTRLHMAEKMVKLDICFRRDVFSYACLGVQAFLYSVNIESIMLYVGEIVLLLIIIAVYRNDLKVCAANLIRGKKI